MLITKTLTQTIRQDLNEILKEYFSDKGLQLNIEGISYCEQYAQIKLKVIDTESTAPRGHITQDIVNSGLCRPGDLLWAWAADDNQWMQVRVTNSARSKYHFQFVGYESDGTFAINFTGLKAACPADKHSRYERTSLPGHVAGKASQMILNEGRALPGSEAWAWSVDDADWLPVIITRAAKTQYYYTFVGFEAEGEFSSRFETLRAEKPMHHGRHAF